MTSGKDLLLLQAAISAPRNRGYKQIPKKGKLRPRQHSFTLFDVQMEQLHPFFLFTGPFSHQQVHFFSGPQSDPHHLPRRWTELSWGGNTAKSWRPQRDTSTLWQRGGVQQDWTGLPSRTGTGSSVCGWGQPGAPQLAAWLPLPLEHTPAGGTRSSFNAPNVFLFSRESQKAPFHKHP